MKTIKVETYGAPKNLLFKEADIPVPKADEVLIKLFYAGVNPVDTYHRANSNGYGPALPFTPGLDGSGVIETIGKSVTKFSPGDRVYLAALRIAGTYSEYIVADETEVKPLPEHLTLTQGAGVFVPYYTAWGALNTRGHAVPGETVLIHGASGAVGQACLQIARASGLFTAATAGSESGCKLLEDLGADVVADHRDSDHMHYIIQEINERNLDLIIEFRADRNLDKDLEYAGKNARIIIVGSRGEIAINPRFTMGKNLNVLGFSLFNCDKKTLDMIHSELDKGAEAGWLDPGCWKIHDLKDAAAAHELIEQGASMGRILLRIQPE